MDSYCINKLDIWPNSHFPILNGNHFSCSNNDGLKRSLLWKNELGMPSIKDYTDFKEDSQKKIRLDIKNKINNFINSI